MDHSAVVKAVRKYIKSKEETDVQAAILVVHLNMLEEAEQLLLGCGRFDLLDKLYKDIDESRIVTCTTTGEMEAAFHFYTLAKDYLFLVRVYCYCNNLEKAVEIGSQMGNISACYHLARQYENIDNIAETIHFFTSAQAYSNAVPMYERLDAHKFEIPGMLFDDWGRKLSVKLYHEK